MNKKELKKLKERVDVLWSEIFDEYEIEFEPDPYLLDHNKEVREEIIVEIKNEHKCNIPTVRLYPPGLYNTKVTIGETAPISVERLKEKIAEAAAPLTEQVGKVMGPIAENAEEFMAEVEAFGQLAAESGGGPIGWEHYCTTQASQVTVYDPTCSYCGEKEECGWKHYCKVKFHDIVVKGPECEFCHLQGDWNDGE